MCLLFIQQTPRKFHALIANMFCLLTKKNPDTCASGILKSMYGFIPGISEALECWQCIGENCGEAPQNVDSATKRRCKDGEACEVSTKISHSTPW